MDKITHVQGKVIPLAMDDIDTDLIIPAQYLTSVSAEGYGDNVFRRLRDNDPDFAFNRPEFKEANILVAKDNFGCGSSREHAVWALRQAGIQVIIATSFADIFANNAAKNGLVLIEQPANIVTRFLAAAESGDYHLDIDVDAQTIKTPDGESLNFQLDPFNHYCFVNGLDELDYLLQHKTQIEVFKQQQKRYVMVD